MSNGTREVGLPEATATGGCGCENEDGFRDSVRLHHQPAPPDFLQPKKKMRMGSSKSRLQLGGTTKRVETTSVKTSAKSATTGNLPLKALAMHREASAPQLPPQMSSCFE